ncbi:putative ATP-dependent RNA helicase DDX4, partial [Manis javanica]
FSNNKFEEADRSAFWRGSEYEQDEETQPTGGVFGSRRPALSGAAIAVEEFHTVDVFAQYIYERGIWIQYTTTNSVANLCQTLHDNIAKAGYSKLTPVREYGIPVTLAGRDLIACAQTGSGKTDTYSSGANGDTSNRTPASSAEMDDGPSQRDHFMRRGFPSRRSLGNRRFSNNKFEEADRSAFWRGSEYEQDEGTQPTGGVFGSRRPALSGA